MTTLTPASEAELGEAIARAAAARTPLEITGGGTRRALGRPVQADTTVSTAAIRGIRLYEPGALTLVVAAGTPLAEIEGALGAEGQRLPFEPMDHRALLGSTGEPTIGGVVACGISGPRRIQAGACRDSMIGVRFVNGRGEAVTNGGRVMKNVTGYDLVKLMAGSFGTLGVITEIGFKVLPRPERALTLVLEGLDDERAVEALSAAMTAPFDVNGAAHLPATSDTPARTLLRVEGLGAQAEYRATSLGRVLSGFGAAARVEGEGHDVLWCEVRDAARFAGRDGAVWRVSLRPSDASGAVARIRRATGGDAFYDWAGGLVWLCLPETGDAGAATIRAETSALGGHATLIRASAATRAAVDVFEPEPAPLARISAGLRARFDPEGILNPARMRA